MMQGTSALAAPISAAGPLLSQPASSTTASSGFERIVSSTSIDARLRYIIAAGFWSASPGVITGNSSGRPPACKTPRFTAVARPRRCTLQPDQLTPHVANADHGTPAQGLVGKAVVTQPAAMAVAVQIETVEPAAAAQVGRTGSGHRQPLNRTIVRFVVYERGLPASSRGRQQARTQVVAQQAARRLDRHLGVAEAHLQSEPFE